MSRSTVGPTTKPLLLTLALSVTLNGLNSTLITVALVPIGATYGVGPAQTAWLITALYLASSAGQVVIGQFVDQFGARRLLYIGSVAAAAAGALGMAAPNLMSLIAVRVLLGLATCVGFPASMAILRRLTPANDTPSGALAFLAVSNQTTMIIGPTLGGLLISGFGWPAVFAVNVPLGIASLILAARYVPHDPPRPAESQRIDYLGIALFAAALVTALLFVMRPSLHRMVLTVASAALWWAFVRRENRTAAPFIDLHLLGSNRPLLRTFLRQGLAYVVIYTILFGFVQWVQVGRGVPDSTAGLMLMPMSVAALLASASGRSGSARHFRLGASAVTLTVASLCLLLLHRQSSLWVVGAVSAAFGVAQGLQGVTNQGVMFMQSPAGTVGAASGLFRTAQFLGGVASSTVIALCYRSHADSSAIHRTGITLAVVSIPLVVLTLRDPALRALERVAVSGDAPEKELPTPSRRALATD